MLLLLAALLLRAGIPDGYMPASPGSGLLFELCPSGVSPEFMHLLGDDHRHHGEGADASQFDAQQCPIGHLLSPAAAVDVDSFASAVVGPEVYVVAPTALVPTRIVVLQRVRGPPA
jgi:hypothetical protein